MEQFPDGGFFKGKNFVFDHRYALTMYISYTPDLLPFSKNFLLLPFYFCVLHNLRHKLLVDPVSSVCGRINANIASFSGFIKLI